MPMVLANELLGRARDHYLSRRGIIDAGHRQEVRYGIPFTYPIPEADGWLHLSNLADRIEGVYYRILWHPEMDKLRLDGPRR